MPAFVMSVFVEILTSAINFENNDGEKNSDNNEAITAATNFQYYQNEYSW